MARKTKEAADHTRKAILRAAAKQFAARGYRSVTLSDLAEEVGVTRGAVYGHFANKSDLLAEVFERNREKVHKQLRSLVSIDCGRSPLEDLVRVCRCLLEGGRTSRRRHDYGMPLPISSLRIFLEDSETASRVHVLLDEIREAISEALNNYRSAEVEGSEGFDGSSKSLLIQALIIGLAWLAEADTSTKSNLEQSREVLDFSIRAVVSGSLA
jgi:AcrR family transcriptional regulator